eukprot:TRINITY_DN42603_c0_g2_i1.p1 TRINITY_DN42603_c0_g2~~TRINITY_DN42603_c0_g2_i1.p1  ORF type:complete len:145 (+),score=13.47 TRINITY_DN42603_c0_g2_i1:181-615(+)
MRVVEIVVCFLFIGVAAVKDMSTKARNVEQRYDFFTTTTTTSGKISRREEKSTILPYSYKTIDVVVDEDTIMEEDFQPIQEEENEEDLSSASDIVFEMGSLRDQFARRSRRERREMPVTAHSALTGSRTKSRRFVRQSQIRYCC